MEFPFLKVRKGQISIEFIILLVIMLIYIQTMIQPILGLSLDATQEVSTLGQTRSATQKLADAVDFVALSTADIKQQIHFYLPPTVKVNCDASGKTFSFEVPVRDCPNGICTKNFPVVNNVNLNCDDFKEIGRPSGFLEPGPDRGKYYTISIYKDAGVTYVEKV